ncbi:MAG: type II secretory ATPase GspE/PulE/Tfp pilus assembly ATPase PilB-like protein [Phycisphaerales bacterium]|jgi:type II secretory ATPase GspE/PulE/Tfp pilus assembly ATPase PilB-like protein
MFETSEYVLRSLIEEGRVSGEDAARAVETAKADGSSIEDTLARLGLVSPRDLALAKAMICEYPFVDLDAYETEIDNCERLSREFAETHGVFPLFVLENVATVAMIDPLNLTAIDGLSQALRVEIDPVIADAERLWSLIRRAYSLVSVRGEDTSSANGEAVEDKLDNEPIVAAVNQILDAAVTAGASDIHMCPDEDTLHLRFRIDGVLETQQGPDLTTHASIVQRLKVMAELDITQTRRPQDGKLRFTHSSGPIDVRLSLLPTIHGENVVLRLLRSGTKIGKIAELGMPTRVLEEFERSIAQPHGMVLVTGPTGSGKTTTLYTALAQLNTPERNVMTIEDPVEIRLPWVRQIQANPEVGLTFASALRSILRQDPDVVLVGEIRDEETARIAVQASLTGHLVFATLHTNDAVGSLARLSDFGIEPFAINSALLGTLAQRLIRRVCPTCVEKDKPEDRLLNRLGLDPATPGGFVRGRGCGKCRGTGYAGRLGVYEYMLLTSPLQEMIEAGESVRVIREAARRGGMGTLLDHGTARALAGETSIEELAKLVTMEMVEALAHGAQQ